MPIATCDQCGAMHQISPPVSPPVSLPAVRISLYYTAMFGMVGVYMPFMPVWLKSRGLDETEIGILLSCMMWIRVISNPFATQLADRLGERKRMMLILAAAATGIAACLSVAWGFWAILFVALLYTAVHAPLMPLGDNVALLTARERGLDYGRMRLWGSLAFIATSFGAGAVLEGRPDSLILWMIVGLLGLTFLSILGMPDVRPTPIAKGRRPARILLADRLFLLFVAAAALSMASHAVLNGFATIHWRSAGIGDDVIGILWAVGVVAEVVLFALARQIVPWLGTAGLLAIGAGAGIVRWIGSGLTTDLWILFPLQALHALTFGATHLGAMSFIQNAVPPELSATAQGLYASIGMGLVVGLTMMASGWLYAGLGGYAFLVMTLLSGASLAVAAALASQLRAGSQVSA